MPTIRRLADSCLIVRDGNGATLFDPGFFTFESGDIDLGTIGDIQRILITHEHGDHVAPAFVKWLLDRGRDVRVYANQTVADLLIRSDIEVDTDLPVGVSAEDVLHNLTPTGAKPPNRSYTIDGILTHPGDSHQPTVTAPVLGLALSAPWTSTTDAIGFAVRLAPSQVVPIHDFWLSASGRDHVTGMAASVLAKSGIELVPLGWGDAYTV